ncbi:MAG TPA: hypothetical protein DIU15_11600 [Deltaproteobacteria bacterium]|nr:hypothetical protein [Deltaproteobacteria bacterium]
MVLVSHTHEFIFMKTHKTASTSVEMFFERYCVPKDHSTGSEAVFETVSEVGIVGARRSGKRRGDIWRNHATAEHVRGHLAAGLWERYLKFTTVRNPYAQVLSNFFWLSRLKPADSMDELLRQKRKFARFVHGRRFLGYRKLVQRNKCSNDFDIVAVDGAVAMDQFIRFEHLHEDLGRVCAELGLPFDEAILPHTKKNPPMQFAPSAYYTDELVARVRQDFGWVFDRFDYAMLA